MKVLLQPANAVIEIDDADLPLFSAHRWTIVRGGHTRYATCRIGRKMHYLHRLVAGAPDGQVVDHIDGNGLNNSRANLRAVTQQQNTWNRHNGTKVGRHGAYWNPMMRIEGKRLHLGMFPDEHTAKQARAYVASQLRGDFAPETGISLDGFDPMLLSPTIRAILAA